VSLMTWRAISARPDRERREVRRDVGLQVGRTAGLELGGVEKRFLFPERTHGVVAQVKIASILLNQRIICSFKH